MSARVGAPKIGLLLLTDHSLNFINLAASLVYMFTVPYAAIQLRLYYFDLEARGIDAQPGADAPDRSAGVSPPLGPLADGTSAV